jgi:dephospho-CoA kinase
MKKFAICGNIASGKSVVQKILQDNGYKILDTDEVAHKLLTVSNKNLFEAFKDFDVFENGEFSRNKLGQLVFANENLRMKLNEIMHPQIALEIEMFFKQCHNDEIVFVAIPLLFEAKMENLFDKILFIYADDNLRLNRLMKRNNYTTEQAKARINSQLPQDEKIKLCDYVINNNGTVEELENATKIFLKQV